MVRRSAAARPAMEPGPGPIGDFQVFGERPRGICGSETQSVAVEVKNMTARRPADTRCAFDQSLQNGLKITGRATDDLENF